VYRPSRPSVDRETTRYTKMWRWLHALEARNAM
jgi:hypothetical protein